MLYVRTIFYQECLLDKDLEVNDLWRAFNEFSNSLNVKCYAIFLQFNRRRKVYLWFCLYYIALVMKFGNIKNTKKK